IRWMNWLARRGSVMCRLTPRSNFEPDAQARDIPSLALASGSRLQSMVAGMFVPVLLVLAAFSLQVCGVRCPVLGAGWARPDPTEMPTELLPDLRKEAENYPPGSPIFNEMLFGGFLTYYAPEFRIFIDDRCELYGDKGLLDYSHALFEN